MLLGNDVIDLEAVEGIVVLMDVTVLTAVACPLPYLVP